MDKCLQIAGLKGITAISEGANFIFSPLSITATLGLAAYGAHGKTCQELLYFIGSPDCNELYPIVTKLISAVITRDQELNLSFFSGAWVDHSMTINPSFKMVANYIFRAHIESADFNMKAALEQKKINDWVEENTNGLVKDIIPDGSINNLTRLVLANALYFKGKWQQKFDKSMTKKDNFYLLNGATVQVPFMSSTESQLISYFEGFKVLKLQYKEEAGTPNKKVLSLLIFLPNERGGLHNLIKRAVSDPNFINKHVPYTGGDVDCLMVPKFKISFNFEASKELKQLGLNKTFDNLRADLRGFCGNPTERDELFVSSIHHKAVIEVDEEGTTAAEATVLIMLATCLAPTYNFVADHPFMFVVREDKSGAILFLGHVVDPSI